MSSGFSISLEHLKNHAFAAISIYNFTLVDWGAAMKSGAVPKSKTKFQIHLHIFSHDLGSIGAEILLSNHLNNYGARLKGRWGRQRHWHHRDTQNQWASTNSAHPLKQGVCNASSGAHLLAQQHWRKACESF